MTFSCAKLKVGTDGSNASPDPNEKIVMKKQYFASSKEFSAFSQSVRKEGQAEDHTKGRVCSNSNLSLMFLHSRRPAWHCLADIRKQLRPHRSS